MIVVVISLYIFNGGEIHQTTKHIIEEWPLTAFPWESESETCNVYTKQVLMLWNGCGEGLWNCESVPNEQQRWLPC